ncbi:unnamed protein product [Oppiella nova]|uniref:Cytochrome P450 n=1 Tax=Oppiella nova TaxID=334625 RepID=A0A7R9M3J2_9ACAR|nr:unnamed protein product [Oppiella nova]CAG2170099.1 unnamed protein product [Oppiella nova]
MSKQLMYLKHRFTFWERQGVAGHEGLEPSILKPGFVHENDLKNFQEFGHIYGYYEFFRRGLVINDPDVIRDVFVRHFDVFRDNREMYFGEDSINLNLFNLKGDDRWKRIRSVCSPAFTSSKMKAMMPYIEIIGDEFVHSLGHLFDETQTNGSIELDVKRVLSAFLTDAINSFAFSIKTNALKDPNQPIVEFGRKVFAVESKFSLILSVMLPNVAKLLRVQPFPTDAINYFKELTHKLVKERVEENLTESKKRKDFLQIMIDANRESDDALVTDDIKEIFESHDIPEPKPTAGQTLSTIEMTAQCILFFVAGFDTTTSALAHTLHYLSKHPDIQRKLYDEVESVADFSADTLATLPYLNAVIHESLRLAPPVLRVERVAKHDITLNNILVPAGTICTVTPYTLHRDSRWWSDPHTFNPDRFVDSPLPHPYALLPFGGGPRMCLGMRFALIEMRLCLTKLVQNFRFKTSASDPHLEYYMGNAFFSPKEVVLGLEKRDK